MADSESIKHGNTMVERADDLSGADLDDLCYATEESAKEGIGFNWLDPPAREVLERYWRGVLVVPERTLFVGRLEGTVVGAVQLVRPGPNLSSTAFTAALDAHFVAPFARGYGLAKRLLQAAEEEAIMDGYSVIRLDVQETQSRAIQLYLSTGYKQWGVLPKYKQVGDKLLAGHFFYKELSSVWW